MSHEDAHLLLPADAAWLALECPENPMTITVMMRLDGLTAGRLKAFLHHYWLAWDRFQYLPVKRPPGWWWEKDPTFALNHHIEIVSGALQPDQLQDWVSARLNQPLPDYRPRWKFWLVPDAIGGSRLLLRIHHCYGDGIALLGIFERLCPASPRQPPAVYGAREYSGFGRWSRAANAWLQGLTESRPSSDHLSPAGSSCSLLPKLAAKSLRLVNETSQFVTEPADTPTVLKRSLLGRRSCCWTAPVALESFRTAAKLTGSTINDVLLSCVTAAIRKHIQSPDSELDDAILHAAVPVDIRKQLPEGLKPEACGLGNYFGTVFVPLPVDGASALERLFRVKHETRRMKASWQPGISWGLVSAAPLLPENLRQPVADLLYRKASAVVSNVPGTREARYLAGCRIEEQMFWVPQAGNIGLGISIVSYAGQVQFGVVADEAVMTGLDVFLGHCLAELDLLTEQGAMLR